MSQLGVVFAVVRSHGVVRALSVLLVLAGCLACSAPARARPAVAPRHVDQLVEQALPYALGEYLWFHENPELSNQEQRTAARLAQSMRKFGMEVHPNIGGHGFVAVLKGTKPGKGHTVLYRADMDALPVAEKTGVPYASKNAGVMHACGHDVHMGVAVAAMQVMATLKNEFSGTVLFVAQPAEELGEGARRMLSDPRFSEVLDNVGKPRLAVALHDTADLPAGTVALSGGFITANVDSVDLVFHGRGGHGAKPHEAIDPVVMAAEAVLQFQTIVSRRIRPERPAVITVGKFSAGTKHNIIPPTAELLLTVRSYDDETRATLLREIQHVANEVAEAYHAPKPPTFVHDAGSTPSGFNDQEWSRRLRERFSELLGDDQVVDNPPTMVGEDFALFSRQLGVPGVMWRLGAVNPSVYERAKPGDLPGLHSDLWAPDAEHTLPVGARTVVAALIEVLEVR